MDREWLRLLSGHAPQYRLREVRVVGNPRRNMMAWDHTEKSGPGRGWVCTTSPLAERPLEAASFPPGRRLRTVCIGHWSFVFLSRLRGTKRAQNVRGILSSIPNGGEGVRRCDDNSPVLQHCAGGRQDFESRRDGRRRGGGSIVPSGLGVSSLNRNAVAAFSPRLARPRLPWVRPEIRIYPNGVAAICEREGCNSFRVDERLRD